MFAALSSNDPDHSQADEPDTHSRERVESDNGAEVEAEDVGLGAAAFSREETRQMARAIWG